MESLLLCLLNVYRVCRAQIVERRLALAVVVVVGPGFGRRDRAVEPVYEIFRVRRRISPRGARARVGGRRLRRAVFVVGGRGSGRRDRAVEPVYEIFRVGRRIRRGAAGGGGTGGGRGGREQGQGYA